MNTPTTTPTEESMPKKDFQQVQLHAVEHSGGMKLAFNNFAELEKFSHFMALSNFVPKHLRQKQADCLAVLLQSMRWEMDPFSVAQKTYFVNDGMAYEAQLVNAIILARAPLKARPKLKWTGEGEGLKCEVSATFKDEDEPAVFEAEMKTITTRNSPLWKQQPKQQLGYFATRAWARLYCPDVLMGIYTKEEMEDKSFGFGADNALDITPKNDSAIDNLNELIKAEKQDKKPDTAGAETVDPETGEVLPTLADYLDDFANVPTVEGLDHKFSQATAQFKDDAPALAQLTLAKTERKKALEAPAEEVKPKESGGKKLFEKTAATAA